jgi:hypothetical protein
MIELVPMLAQKISNSIPLSPLVPQSGTPPHGQRDRPAACGYYMLQTFVAQHTVVKMELNASRSLDVSS